MRKKQILATMVAVGLAVNFSTSLVANAETKGKEEQKVEQEVKSEEKPEVKPEIETKKEEVVKLTAQNTVQKIGEKLNYALFNAKAINVNDATTEYAITYSADLDSESPISEAMDKNEILNKIGTFNVVIIATNSRGVKVAEIVKQVKVIEEEKKEDFAPVIEGSGKIIKQGTKFDIASLGIKATDKEDGDLTDKLEIKGSVDTTKLGYHSITATVKDSAGNVTSEVFTVVVKENSKPEIAGVGNLKITVGDKFDNSMLKVKASDKEDGDLTSKVVYEGKVNTTKIGKYNVVAKITDSDNNTVEKTFMVQVEAKKVTPKPANPDKPKTSDEGAVGLGLGLAALLGLGFIKKH